jgi:hypothetical protein
MIGHHVCHGGYSAEVGNAFTAHAAFAWDAHARNAAGGCRIWWGW